MLIPIHPGCGGIIRSPGLCSHCGKQPDRIFQFEDPTIPCESCGRDYLRGHNPACKVAERRMKKGHAVLIQSIFDRAGDGPPAVACFAILGPQ